MGDVMVIGLATELVAGIEGDRLERNWDFAWLRAYIRVVLG